MRDEVSHSGDVAATKARLRAAALAARDAMPADARARADATIRAALVPLARGRIVAAYVPLATEPGGPQLTGDLANVAGRLLLPVLRPDLDLDWAEYNGELRPAGRGVHEPTGPRLGADAVLGAELIVVPALGVDRRGVRLGRGGGSYDRALARARAAWRLAVLYDDELVAEVPAEPHDQRVHAVVTPGTGVRRVG